MAKKPDKPTPMGAIRSQCWYCCAEYMDGMMDCETVRCPSYYYMPYRKLEPDLWWMEFNPKRKGRVTWEESSRPITDEQRKELSERLQKMREKKDL